MRPSLAGAAYLDLQNRARRERRGTQELLTLYVVERWLARLSASAHASKFVIKGGMLLAAYDARRPTADLDALARSIADIESEEDGSSCLPLMAVGQGCYRFGTARARRAGLPRQSPARGAPDAAPQTPP